MSKRKKKNPPSAVQEPATRWADGPVKYYWAYGSNLNIDQMLARCPDAKALDPLYLNNAALVFRLYADVVGRKDSRIAGGLWKVTPDDIEALDRYEGVKSGFYRKLYFTLNYRGREEPCLFYKMTRRYQKGVSPPSDAYLETIVKGFEDFGLERELLDSALQHAWNRKLKTPDVKSRWVKAGKPKLARAIKTPFREEWVSGA